MKLISIFLIALLALNVLAAANAPAAKPAIVIGSKPAAKPAVVPAAKPAVKPADKKAGSIETSTRDDWSEKTDIQHREKSSSKSWRTESTSYKLRANESFVGSEYEKTDGKAAVWKNVTEHVLRIVNGSIVNTTETRRVKIDTHRKIQRVRTIIHTKHRIRNVIEVVKSFSDAYGKALSAAEFKLINTIITTDDNKFKMDYKIEQIRKVQLESALKQIARIFTLPISEADFDHWEYLISKDCGKHYQVIAPDTSSVEVHRSDLWIVKTEVIMATCGNASSPGYQIFGWSASKSGAYHKGQYSVANSKKVDELVTRWLYSNMSAMINCKNVHVTESSSSAHKVIPSPRPSRLR